MTKIPGHIKRHRMNTIRVIYREPEQRHDFYKKTNLLAVNLLGASLISWTTLILIYEIPCFLGKTSDLDLPVIRAAIRADQAVTMKYRAKSYSVNRLIHELEEMKVFYSQI